MKFSELPEPLIQLIQSLLTSKQAAQTSLLSKSWRSAFLTRPNLDFDQADFLRLDGTHEIVPFWDYVWNAVARYSESNHSIHTFSIHVHRKWHFHYTRLILRALANGATRLRVEVRLGDFHVPKEVLGSTHLVALTLKRSIIYLDLMHQEQTCSRLESLCLEDVRIKIRDLFSRVMSTCPLIQNVTLSLIDNEVHYPRGNVVAPALVNLRSLVLVDVDFDTLFLRDLSSNFPVLEDLTLHTRNEQNEEDVIISSRSLERTEVKIKIRRPLYGRTIPRVRFELPSIRKFTFEGTFFSVSLLVDEKTSTSPNHFVYGLNDRREVRAQIFDEAVSTWRDVALKSLGDGLTTQRDFIRLNWQLI